MPQPQQVICPDCTAEFRLPASAAREKWHCSDCGAELSAEQPLVVESTEETSRLITYAGSAFSGSTEKILVPPVGPGESADAWVRRGRATKADAPPKRVFFSNVFGFPLQGSVIAQWMLLSGSFTGLALINLLLVSLYVAAATAASGVMGFIALPAFWIGLWTLSYAAACFLIVVQETGAGNNEIRDWMEGGWREWAAELFCLLYIAALPMMIAWPIVKLTGYSYSQAAVPLLIFEFLFFPFALLSALEQDSIWMPFSLPIIRSLFKIPGGWCAFYLLSGLLFVVCGGTGYFALRTAHVGMAFVVGPVIAATILVYARLIGRLGWLILDRVPRTDSTGSDLLASEPYGAERW